MTTPTLLTFEEVREHLRVSPGTLRGLMAKNAVHGGLLSGGHRGGKVARGAAEEAGSLVVRPPIIVGGPLERAVQHATKHSAGKPFAKLRLNHHG